MVKKAKNIKKNAGKVNSSSKITKMRNKKSESKKNLNKRTKENKEEIKDEMDIPNFKHFKKIVNGHFFGFSNKSFCAFKSIVRDCFYLVYIKDEYSLIIYDLINYQKLNEIKQNCINTLKHYEDSINKISYVHLM